MNNHQTPRTNYHLMKAVIPVNPSQLDLPDALTTDIDRIVAAEVARTGNRADVVRVGVHEWMIEKLMKLTREWMP